MLQRPDGYRKALYAVDRVQSTKPMSEILPAVAQSFRPSANVSGLATGPDHEIAPVSGAKAPQSRMQAFRGNSGRYRSHAEPDQKPWPAMGFSAVDHILRDLLQRFRT